MGLRNGDRRRLRHARRDETLTEAGMAELRMWVALWLVRCLLWVLPDTREGNEWALSIADMLDASRREAARRGVEIPKR